MDIRFYSAQSVGARDYQQDRIAVSPAERRKSSGVLSLLCDGMGGMKDGEKYAEIGCTVMLQELEKHRREDDLPQVLLSCFEAANRQAEAIQPMDASEQGGSTVTAVLIKGTRCCFLSCGDSRIVLVRQGGMIQLSRDQNLGNVLDVRAAMGLADREMVRGMRGRGALTGYLGMKKEQIPDLCTVPFRLLEGDRIIQMSDGVYNTLSETEILSIVLEPPGDKDPARKVIDAVLAKRKPAQDNCSIIIQEIARRVGGRRT